jgi:hypothetical protein
MLIAGPRGAIALLVVWWIISKFAYITEDEDCCWYSWTHVDALSAVVQNVVSVDSQWSLLLLQPAVQQQHQQLMTMMITT